MCNVLNPESEEYFFIYVFSLLSFSMLWVGSKTAGDINTLITVFSWGLLHVLRSLMRLEF